MTIDMGSFMICALSKRILACKDTTTVTVVMVVIMIDGDDDDES